MKTDIELKKDVEAELEFDPGVLAENIWVEVEKGIVTLNGTVRAYNEKVAAVRAVQRVAGVTVIVDEIKVRLPVIFRREDAEIAAVAMDTLRWVSTVSLGAIRMTVRSGVVTLEGTVKSWYQKNTVEELMRHLTGVKDVTNLITIEAGKLSATEVISAIDGAFKRHALLDARKVVVETSGNKVVLKGRLGSYHERDEAERAAWSVPGVSEVDDQIVIAN